MLTPYARNGIHIKPENKGKFTTYANQHDETVQQAASRILGNKEEYSPTLVKRANFARNAAGWQKAQNGAMAGYPPPLDWMSSLYDPNKNDLYMSTDNEWAGFPYAADVMQPNKATKFLTDADMEEYTRKNYLQAQAPTFQVSSMVLPDMKMPQVPRYIPSGREQGVGMLNLRRDAGLNDNPYLIAQQNQAEAQRSANAITASNTNPPTPSLKTPYMGVPNSPTAREAALQLQGKDVIDNIGLNLRTADADVPHVLDRNEPEVTLPQAGKEKAASTGYDPQGYFDLTKVLDATALFRNLVQGPPPTIQSPITHMPRVHYDRTIFDQQKQTAKETGLRAMYEARQQLGQAGDIQNLMLGYNAQQQQAMAQLGTAEREMGMSERLQNTQIAGQEQQLQDQQNLAENQQNYQLMQQAQHMKDRAVEHQLSNIAKDVREETQYYLTKDTIDKQAAIDKEYKDKQQQIGLAGLELQVEQMYRNNPDYQTGLNTKMMEHARQVEKDVRAAMMTDPTWSGRVTDADIFTGDITGLSTRHAEEAANYSVMEQQASQAQKDLEAKQKALDELIAPDPSDTAATNTYNINKEEYTKALADSQAQLSRVEQEKVKTLQQRDELKRQYDVQNEMLRRIQESRDYQGVKQTYDEGYRANSPMHAILKQLRGL